MQGMLQLGGGNALLQAFLQALTGASVEDLNSALSGRPMAVMPDIKVSV